MSDTTTTTTTIVSNVHLTSAEFSSELVICRGIFINYTHYHASSALYDMVSEEMYWGNSLYLNSLLLQLESYWYDTETGTYYCGGLEVDESDVITVIDFIHHYGELDYTLNAEKFTGGVTGPDDPIVDPNNREKSTTTTTTTEPDLQYPGFSARFINHQCEIIFIQDPTTTTTTTTEPDTFVVRSIDYVCEEVESVTTTTTSSTTTTTTTEEPITTTTTTLSGEIGICYHLVIPNELLQNESLDDLYLNVTYPNDGLYREPYTSFDDIGEVPNHFVFNQCSIVPITFQYGISGGVIEISEITVTENGPCYAETTCVSPETTTTTTTEAVTTTTTTETPANFSFRVDASLTYCSINWVKLNGIHLIASPVMNTIPKTGTLAPVTNGTLEVSYTLQAERNKMLYQANAPYATDIFYMQDRHQQTTVITKTNVNITTYLWLTITP